MMFIQSIFLLLAIPVFGQGMGFEDEPQDRLPAKPEFVLNEVQYWSQTECERHMDLVMDHNSSEVEFQMEPCVLKEDHHYYTQGVLRLPKAKFPYTDIFGDTEEYESDEARWSGTGGAHHFAPIFKKLIPRKNLIVDVNPHMGCTWDWYHFACIQDSRLDLSIKVVPELQLEAKHPAVHSGGFASKKGSENVRISRVYSEDRTFAR